MKPSVSPSQFHKALAQDLFPQPPTLEEALCLILLLHACPLRLNSQAEVRARLRCLLKIDSHPWVDQLVDEDWDLLSKLE